MRRPSIPLRRNPILKFSVLVAGIALLLLGVVATVVIASAPDSDGDGMSDAFELLFGLDMNSAADAPLNYDADTLSNLAESEVATDPWTSDSDRDGWHDGVDQAPLSRIYVNWGDPMFTDGDDFVYTGPAWWLSAFRTDGQWETNPPAWHVPDSEPDGVGSLCIEIDRALQTNDLTMAVALYDHADASLVIDLLDETGATVAADLFGNILTGTDEGVELSLALPLIANPTAAAIRLTRVTGAVTIYETRLYVDEDSDGLDSDQETQIGTSDQSIDTDTDGLTDPSEANIHQTDPTLPDTDNDGAWDGWEVLDGYDALSSGDRPTLGRTRIAAANTHNLMVLPDGTVLTWGDNGGGRTGQDTTTAYLSSVTRVLSADGSDVLDG
ncbi:MAG: hypothetical protein HN341_04910, partial [Verrucomicrobia bacterium]|nr:hypothetical protein [Verrucomicrobiota bacterium]